MANEFYDMENVMLENWTEVAKVACSTAVSFVVLFVFIRLTGKRTLASLSAFDFVVIIALGSTLAEMMLLEIPLVHGAVALVVILSFQFGLAWAARKSRSIENVLSARPTLLFIDGIFLEAEMTREKVTEDELYSEIRGAGIFDLDDIKAIVLELNGHVTIVKNSELISPKRHSLKQFEHLLDGSTLKIPKTNG